MKPPFVAGAVDGTCSWCHGRGVLPGSNWVAQGTVAPNCFHCNGQGGHAAGRLPDGRTWDEYPPWNPSSGPESSP